VLYDASPLFLPKGQYVILESSKGTQDRVDLIGVLGKHLVYPIAAAHAVAGIIGVTQSCADSFVGFEAPKGRMRLLEGKSQSVVVDDSYNSSPLASKEALVTIGALATRGRKIAVLGDMKELGDLSDKAHREVGGLAGHRVHTLVTVGAMGSVYENGARYGGLAADRIVCFETSTEAGVYLAGIVRAGDVVLVKGSQSVRMERVSQALLADPSRAVDLLVRQEDEWKTR
jgi:UDP-N-acetylmuramyl pentapeptide synthase